MYKFLTKNGQLLAFGVGALLSVVFYLVAFSGLEQFNMTPEDERFETTIFNFGLAAALGLVIIAFAVSVVFAIIQVASHPKGALKGIVGVAVIAVIFLIAYSTADGFVQPKWADEFGVTENISKYVSGALSTTIALAIIAALSFVVAEVRNLFK